MFVSENSLLAVITPAKGARALHERLVERLLVVMDFINRRDDVGYSFPPSSR